MIDNEGNEILKGEVIIYKPTDGLPLDERITGCHLISALCKEDKEQLNRIEEMLNNLLFHNDIAHKAD